MELGFSPVAGGMCDRKELREVADIGVGSTATGHAAVETQFHRLVDGAVPVGVAAMPRRSLRERLRRPLMLVVPIMVAAIGAAVYFAAEPYVSTDNAFVRAAKVTVNASTVAVSASMVTVDAAMSKFSGVIKCDTLITNSVVSTSYTPGAGNIW